MSLAFAAAAGVLFGAGAYLLLKGDLVRVVVGVIVISNAANVTVMAAGHHRGESPIHPAEEPVADPLVQAMTITAIVIGFAVAALLLALVHRVYATHETVDLDELSREEVARERRRERDEVRP